MDNQELIYAVKTATVALERIAAALEVIAGAKPINSIANIVPGSEVELFDGSKAVHVYCNNEFQAPMGLNRGSSLFYENTKSD